MSQHPMAQVFTGRDMVRRRHEQQNEWHAKGAGVEQPMAPHLPIIDPHHHLTNHQELDAWDSDAWPNLDAFGWTRTHALAGRGFKTGFAARYLMEEMLEDTKGNNVRGTVFIETGQFYDQGRGILAPCGETRYTREVFERCVREKAETKLCQGIVSFADLTLGPRLDDVLRGHRDAGGSLFKGIRQSIAGDPTCGGAEGGRPEQMPLPADAPRLSSFIEGVSKLPRYGLVYDCWLFHTQVRQLTEIALRCPGTTIVCNHVAYPLGHGPYADKARRPEILATWKQDMAELARCSNVVCKVGGMTQACCAMGEPTPWVSLKRAEPPSSREIAGTLAPWYLYAIDTFGPRRCMFESNYPMDRVTCSYTNLWNAFKILGQNYSQADNALLFHDTAARVYDLDRSKL